MTKLLGLIYLWGASSGVNSGVNLKPLTNKASESIPSSAFEYETF